MSSTPANAERKPSPDAQSRSSSLSSCPLLLCIRSSLRQGRNHHRHGSSCRAEPLVSVELNDDSQQGRRYCVLIHHKPERSTRQVDTICSQSEFSVDPALTFPLNIPVFPAVPRFPKRSRSFPYHIAGFMRRTSKRPLDCAKIKRQVRHPLTQICESPHVGF